MGAKVTWAGYRAVPSWSKPPQLSSSAWKAVYATRPSYCAEDVPPEHKVKHSVLLTFWFSAWTSYYISALVNVFFFKNSLSPWRTSVVCLFPASETEASTWERALKTSVISMCRKESSEHGASLMLLQCLVVCVDAAHIGTDLNVNIMFQWVSFDLLFVCIPCILQHY